MQPLRTLNDDLRKRAYAHIMRGLLQKPPTPQYMQSNIPEHSQLDMENNLPFFRTDFSLHLILDVA